MIRHLIRFAGAIATFCVAPVAVVHASTPPLMLGSAWYPEQWPESRWDADLALMQEAGFHMVRIGEFAWSSLEPEEGKFTLDWMDRAITAAAARGMIVVLGTPTDAPPAWLTSKYPETLRVDETGRRLQHGQRRQFSYASSRYRELCRRVVEQMARRFGNNPHVIGWQIGNEYTDDSFDPEARRMFHQWLEARYGSLEELNRQWVTAYWSQTYSAWDQVPMGVGRGNPGLLLDYKRFVTDTWRSFQRNQLDALRQHIKPRQFVTTNLGGLGWANRFNRREISADLDLITWDNYVGSGHLEPYRNGATHDLVRGWRRQNFWVMEMQPGFVDWAGVSNALEPGETRALVWSAIGHGADCVAFWQWRSALNGQEQYHGAIVGPDGDPLPLYAEAQQTARELTKTGSALAGTSPESQVAILHDYDSRWAIDFNPHSRRYDQIEVLLSYYRPLKDATQSVDIVDPMSPLDNYKLVVAPSLNVISPETAKHLRAYVEKGGWLILGPRSGMKNEFNALNVERQPGPLVASLGGRVEQFYALLEDVPVEGAWGRGTATIWGEHLAPRDADVEVPLRYGAGHGWLEGQPAAMMRPLGRGRMGYLGAVLSPEVMSTLVAQLLEGARVTTPTISVPKGVEVNRRLNSEREIFVLVNTTRRPAEVSLPGRWRDLLRDSEVEQLTLRPYDVAVVEKPRERR
jgi:beta-galactosidase